MKPTTDMRPAGRELQVLELAAKGMTDKQIAATLNISAGTVGSYWRRILSKYGSCSRTEVVARHAHQKAMTALTESSQGDPQLLEEMATRTLAQANELAQRNLLQAITESSLEYISGQKGFREVFERFLQEVLGLTQSEYGFLAEVLYDEDANPYLKTHSITNIAWNRETRELYDKYYFDGLEFRNLETLFGRVLTTGEVLISNNPYEDPRRGGLPPGHPPMPSFLGIPVFSGDDLVGMIGIANRPGGYDDDVVDYLRPMTATFANFIVGLRAERERQAIENQLAESATLVTTLTNALPAAILFEDTKRNLQFVNPAFLEIFGAQGSPDDFIGMNCELVAEYSRPLFADPEGFFRRVHELLEAQETAAGDIVRLTNGKVYERDFVVVRQRATVLGYLWKYREITAWRSEHEALGRVLDAALDAVIVMDSNGTVSFWNAKAESLFGYTPDEAIGRVLADLIVPEHLREPHRAGLERFLSTRQSTILDQMIRIDGRCKDGRAVSLDLRITCIEEGTCPKFSAFIRPVDAKH